MTKIEWDSSLAVGIDLIDEQHKMLIEKLSNISEAIELTRGSSEIAQTLDFMVEYTDFHFSTEERHMIKYDFPHRDYHIAQHEEFKKSLDELVYDFREEGATKALGTAISTFLLNWLINHIKGVDVIFGKFLNEKGCVMTEE